MSFILILVSLRVVLNPSKSLSYDENEINSESPASGQNSSQCWWAGMHSRANQCWWAGMHSRANQFPQSISLTTKKRSAQGMVLPH